MYRADWLPETIRAIRRKKPNSSVAIPAKVWYLGLTSLLMDLSAEMVASVLPFYLVTQLQMGTIAFGALDGVQQLVRLAALTAGGWLAVWTQRLKFLASVGYGLSVVSRIGWLVVGPWIAGLSALVGLDNVGKGLRTAPRDALIAGCAPAGATSRTFGVHRAMDAVGALAGPFVAFAILSRSAGTISPVFVASAVFAVLSLSVIGLFVSDHAHAATPARESSLRRTLATLSRPRMRPLAVMTLCLAAASVSDAWMFVMVQGQHTLPAAQFPLLYVAMNAAFFCFAIPSGIVADRVGRITVFLAGHLALVSAYLLLGFGGLTAQGMWIVPILLGLFYACTDGVLASIASESLEDDSRAGGLALLGLAGGAGRLVASMTFALIVSAGGNQLATGVFAVLLTIVVGVAAGLLRNRARVIS